jgi:4-aminobutyrate aminotransferase-like enzyme
VAPGAIAKAIERFKGPDYVYPGYAYPPWTELARLLASLAPRPLTTCFRATGGSEAVDLALQAAMIHTGRRAFLSLEGSYHGNTLAGLSIGASDNRDRIKNLLPHCREIGPPLDATALRRIEQRLKRRDVAAFVIEPISINLGILIPEKDAIRRVLPRPRVATRVRPAGGGSHPGPGDRNRCRRRGLRGGHP